MALQRDTRSLHSVCAPPGHRFRNFCHYRNSLLYCYNAVVLEDIFRFKTAQKRNSKSETTGCAKWQLHVKHCKSTHCTLWIYLAFWLCYLPYIIIVIIEMCLPNTIMEALFMCSETVVLLNSSLNPIIYCWKMRHVRHAVKSILQNIFRSFNGPDGRTVNKTLWRVLTFYKFITTESQIVASGWVKPESLWISHQLTERAILDHAS